MHTEMITVSNTGEMAKAISRAVELLGQGRTVVFPTETVYGVGARADLSVGWEELTRIKQRPADKPFTSHVGNIEEIFRLVPLLNAREKRFINKSLPGPLTIVFDLSEEQIEAIKSATDAELFSRLYFDNSIGIRLPDDQLAMELLTQAGGPVVASSANPAGMPPAFNAEMAAKYLNDQVSLIIDSGPARIQKPSTVVRVSNEKFEILREGIIDSRMIHKLRNTSILFVCTGNTCRSPMAEGFGRSSIAKKLDCGIDQLKENGYHIASAGVMAIDGIKASQESVNACEAFGIDISSHKSRLLTLEMIDDADHILVMSQRHYESIVSIAPEAAGKVRLLAEDGIADPYCQPQGVYDKCARQIKEAVDVFIEELGLDEIIA